MEWQLGSAIAEYLMSTIFIALTYPFSYGLDCYLYDKNKYNESRKTIKLKCFKWIFLRCRKTVKGEIFTIAFIHELISIVLFIGTTAVLIISILQKNDFGLLICIVTTFCYICYCTILDRKIKRNNKKLD